MMHKPYKAGQPEWEQILRALEQGEEVSEDRFNKLSSEERSLISELQKAKRLQKATDQLDEIDLRGDWQSVRARLNGVTDKGRIIPFASKLLRYAAVVLPLAISVSLYFGLKNNKPAQMQVSEAKGMKKPMLILGDGKLIELSGNQNIKTDGAKILNGITNALVYKKVQNIGALPTYNTLIIPKGSEYKLILSDGTEVWVNADTRIKYQINFDATKTREVFLESGEAYFKVTKNPEKPFIVHNGNMNVQVLGTSFNINAYTHPIQTTLVEGKVKVSLNADNRQLELTPGQQANFERLSRSLEKHDVDVYPFVAWKEGVIAFENESMEELMDQIGRLYDYEIVFKDESLKTLHCSGSADKSKSVLDILNILQKTSNIKFTIKERSISIEKTKK